MRLFLFFSALAISCLTARVAAGDNDIGDNNRGNDNIGNANHGNGNIGNNNTGNFNLGNTGHSRADLQEKAAQGDPAAQLELGGRYLFGDGVAEDSRTALQWLQQAAAYADKNLSWPSRSVAFAALGMVYERAGGAENIQQAIDWYVKSAMLNDPRGMAALSRIYSTGEGVPRDIVTGLAWMYVAAASGAPGTVDNDGIKLAIPTLENKAGPDGVILARKKSRDLTAQIK